MASMSAFDHVKDLHDVALKPRLLETLTKDHVPDDKHPSRSSLELSKLVYMIKTHNLLSESIQDPTAQKLISHWRSAVDSWVDRLLLLVSNEMPDKCWAGICLLGVTCQECSSDRFLASYSVWYQKLLSPLQSPTTSQFVKVASCASMSDLLTRLGEFPIVRKDGTAFAGKLIQSVLKLIDDGHSEIVWEEAVRLLCIFISFFPFSISRHYDSVSGICVRVFLKDPKFSLRNPKRFLEGLLDQYLSSIAATHSETQAVDPELPLQIILDTLHLCPNLWLLWQCGPNFLSSLWS